MWKAYSQLRAGSKKKKALAFLIWRCSNQALSRFWFCTGTSIARLDIGGYLELFIYLGALIEFSFVSLQSAFLFICVFQFVVNSRDIKIPSVLPSSLFISLEQDFMTDSIDAVNRRDRQTAVSRRLRRVSSVQSSLFRWRGLHSLQKA